MDLVSTRNSNNIVSFYEAVTNCMPADGGLYIPKEALDLSDWTFYLNEKSSFTSIAGALTSALLQKEFVGPFSRPYRLPQRFRLFMVCFCP